MDLERYRGLTQVYSPKLTQEGVGVIPAGGGSAEMRGCSMVDAEEEAMLFLSKVVQA